MFLEEQSELGLQCLLSPDIENLESTYSVGILTEYIVRRVLFVAQGLYIEKLVKTEKTTRQKSEMHWKIACF